MDHPDSFMTWTVPTPSLTAGKARTLKSAVSIVQRSLDLWREFLMAATSQPLQITVTAAGDTNGGPTVATSLDAHRSALHLEVPHSALRETPGQLAAQILNIMVPALVAIAEQHPHPEPASFWRPPVTDPSAHPPTENPQPGAQLDTLTEGEVLIIGRIDGSDNHTDARFRQLDAYLCERLEEPGIAARGDTGTSDSTAFWTLELLDKN